MVLDTTSLRVAFAVVAFTVGILFYFADYLSTRSPYSGWWCVSLALFLTGSAALLLEATALRWFANPVGNSLLVGGACAVWASARSLRALHPPVWVLLAVPGCSAVAAAVDHPGSNPWAGDAVFLASMCFMIGLAARELWLGGPEASRIRMAMCVAAASVATFYFCRLMSFILDGAGSPRYNTFFGSAVTTLVGMAFLAVASFSMFALSSENRARVLRTAAAQDGLTGLLNRAGFLQEAGDELRRIRLDETHGSLVLADIDHFKDVNDSYGHAAGDVALKSFAGACRAAVRSGDLVGRIGGEEFILLVPGISAERARLIAADISNRFETASAAARFPMPTVSYGIIPIGKETADLDELIAAADAALYMAKSLGRNQVVIGTHRG
ncbi:GGDEF domain-containing protein [Arthrobacter silvisoli]|uniref:GGDEF domain-containing protein n=1 Tax=Arthrobacter silvisoli TaxID=2291022 RepID=UPI000E217006|nr:GGDEF domain-containing protein [Arthrobacter silvisoli]